MKKVSKLIILLFILNACSADRNDLIDAITDHNNPPIDESAIDTDGDGVLDNQEVTDNTDINNSCSFIVASQTVATSESWNGADCDSDGVNNLIEIADATDPVNPDTDDDGITDGDEKQEGTDPTKKDTDEDGIDDGAEKTDKTDPLKSDTDSDGVSDGDEKEDGTNPLKIDTDADGVTDNQEKLDTTNALDRCSFVLNNQQEIPDAIWNSTDCDNDGITNSTEISNGTDPLVYDEPTPVASPIAGVWNLTDGVINDGTGTTVYLAQTFNLTYTATTSDENVQVQFSENPDMVTSTGTYTMLLNFNFLGTDYQDTLTSESPFSNGDWSINGNTLTIDANTTVNGSYDIIELTENTLIISTPIDREVPAGGLNLNVQGTLILTFTK